MDIDIEGLVAQLDADQTSEMLEEAWNAATTEHQEEFVRAHRSKLEEILQNLAE